jgi:hypothetical protein
VALSLADKGITNANPIKALPGAMMFTTTRLHRAGTMAAGVQFSQNEAVCVASSTPTEQEQENGCRSASA